jgi:hypothetical protein
VSLTSVWLQTRADGLMRADLVSSIRVRRAPTIAGEGPHWLLDVVLPASTGRSSLIQTADEPTDAPEQLARLLTQLDVSSAAGIITTSPSPARTMTSDASPVQVQFRFTPFTAVQAGHQYDAEYLLAMASVGQRLWSTPSVQSCV